ncbi:MAG: hypothetical protein ACUVR8_05375 [Acidobacteriota bacterium]
MSLAYILQDFDDPDFEDIHGDDETGGFAADKVLRLLVSSLYTSWRPGDGIPFLAAVRVVLTYGKSAAASVSVVPDILLAQGVAPVAEWWKPVNRIYQLSRFGKAPDLVLDLLTRSPDHTEAFATRHQVYEQLGITYRVVYDPCGLLAAQPVTVFERQQGRLTTRQDTQLPHLGLGLTIWRGTFEGRTDTWLRWTDARGNVLPTGDELAVYWQRRAAALEAQHRDAPVTDVSTLT